MGVCQAGCGGGRLGRPPPARTRKASGMHPMLFFNFMHPSEILANIELVSHRIILDPQLSVQKFACDYSALRRVRSLVRNPLCEYATLLNLVEFKTENKESYLEIFLQFNGLVQKDAVVMFQFFDILDTNFVFSSSVNSHISLLCMVRNDALMRFHIQDGIDSGGGYD